MILPHSTKPSQELDSTRYPVQQHYEDSHSDMDGKHDYDLISVAQLALSVAVSKPMQQCFNLQTKPFIDRLIRVTGTI